METNDSQSIQTARCWQLLGELNLVDSIFNHISILTGSEEQGFVMSMNPEGLLPFEIKPEMIRFFPLKDVVLRPQFAGVNQDGLFLHSTIHQWRRRPGAVIHLHSPYSVAISNTLHGLLPLSQTSIEFMEEVRLVEYGGLLRSDNFENSLKELCQTSGVLLLRNHGLVSIADSIEESFYLAYYMEEACKIQYLTLSQQVPVVYPDGLIISQAVKSMKAERPDVAQKMFDAFCRKFKI